MKSLTIYALSKKSGIDSGYISRIERNIRIPTVLIFARIVEELEVKDINLIFGY